MPETYFGLRITCPSCERECIYEPTDFRSEDADSPKSMKKPASRVEPAQPDAKRDRAHGNH
jgi:hypothetical protein